jgi:hypothetical protein
MATGRPSIPADLERQVMLESGYSCAVCRARPPLDIEHIEEWAKVQEHKFENLIALCPTCHRLKQQSSDPRHINRSSLKKIKANLMMLNGRYSDIERRFIEIARNHVKAQPSSRPTIMLHHTMYLTVKHLIDDKIVEYHIVKGGFMSTDGNGNTITNDELKLTLSKEGREFIDNLNMVD